MNEIRLNDEQVQVVLAALECQENTIRQDEELTRDAQQLLIYDVDEARKRLKRDSNATTPDLFARR